ncbi:MAG: HRDC domain-containing protein [Bacteroidota bacterium]
MEKQTQLGMQDVQEEVWHVCNVLQELGRPLTPSYLIRILKGVRAQGKKSAKDKELESHGTLGDKDPDRLRLLFRFMMEREFLKRLSPKNGSLVIDEKGRDFLRSPFPILVYPRQLSRNRFERDIMSRLRNLRKMISQGEGHPPYMVFTDHTLDELTFRQPTSISSLKEIPGMGDFRINRYGAGILKIIKEVKAKQQLERKEHLEAIVHRPSYQDVKCMYMAGWNIEEMAIRREVKPSTIKKMLADLHEAKLLDLKPMIKKEVPPAILEEGASYFRKHEDARMKVAFQELGISYETLRMCRLYVSKAYICDDPWENNLLEKAS